MHAGYDAGVGGALEKCKDGTAQKWDISITRESALLSSIIDKENDQCCLVTWKSKLRRTFLI